MISMTNKFSQIVAGLVGVALLLAALQADAARFFRYVDERGKLVLSHTIPNDRVKYGYEIVDENARVLQTVAPQLSEAQYQQKLAQEAALKECRNALDRVHGLYRSIDDIDYAELQALESLDTQITNTKANLSHLENQRQALESEAAQLDIAGKKIPASLLDNIESAKTQEGNLGEQIELRYEEKLEVRRSYEYDRKVFVLSNCDNGLPETNMVSQAN